MENCYEVYEGTSCVGKVQLLRQGLYYRLICRCSIQSDSIYRLYIHKSGVQENLGVLIPDEDGISLDRNIPVKRIGDGSFRFSVSCPSAPTSTAQASVSSGLISGVISGTISGVFSSGWDGIWLSRP